MSTRTIAAVPALLLVVIALWEACATRRDASAVPDDDAWERAAKVVRDGYRPGDLIVFAPTWVDPVGRLHLGDLIPLAMAGRMDAAKYGRVWELSIRGAHASEATGTLRQEIAEDGVTVRLYERPAATVLADIRELLPTARIEGGASRELAEVGFEPHDCIQAVPPAHGAVRITFPKLPLGSQLVGYVGLADVFTRRDIRRPGTLEVLVDGKPVAKAVAGVDDGWVRFAASTTPGAADVTFVASADAPQRLICFAAETRP